MNPYLHELRHSLGGAALVATVIFGLLAAGLSYGVVAEYSGPTIVHGSGFYTYENGSFRIVLFVFGATGEPIAGATARLGFLYTGNFGSNGSSQPPRVVATLDATTGSDGRLAVDAPLAGRSYFVNVSIGGVPEPTGQLQVDGALAGFGIEIAPAGTVVPIDPVTVVATSEYTVTGTLVFVSAGPYGALPTGERVVQCSYPAGAPVGSPASCSTHPVLTVASLTEYRTTVSPLPSAPGTEVLVLLLNASGGVIDSHLFGPYFGSGPLSTPTLTVSTPGASALEILDQLLPLLPFLAGFLLAYLRYARPRLNTTLEPVLVRPVSRLGLLLTRYLAIALLLAGVAIAAVVAVDVTATARIGAAMPLSFAGALVGALLATGLSIAGVVFAAAHLFRSGGAVLSLGLTLVFLFGLFWYPLADLFAQIYAPSGGFSSYLLRVGLVSPTLLPYYVVRFLTGSGTSGGPGSSYALAGISAGLVALIAALWVGLPLLAAVARARWSD